jgi:hypothetical protein
MLRCVVASYAGCGRRALEYDRRDWLDEEGTCAVHVSENRFEADIISQALEREGIPCICRRHEETAYDGLFVPQRGWGTILVPIPMRERAMEIIREVREAYDRDRRGG